MNVRDHPSEFWPLEKPRKAYENLTQSMKKINNLKQICSNYPYAILKNDMTPAQNIKDILDVDDDFLDRQYGTILNMFWSKIRPFCVTIDKAYDMLHNKRCGLPTEEEVSDDELRECTVEYFEGFDNIRSLKLEDIRGCEPTLQIFHNLMVGFHERLNK